MRLDSASGRADVVATVAAIVAVALLPAANFGAGRGVTATLLVDISLREDASAEGSRSRLGATGEGRGNESECMPRQCAPERPNYVHIANHAALAHFPHVPLSIDCQLADSLPFHMPGSSSASISSLQSLQSLLQMLQSLDTLLDDISSETITDFDPLSASSSSLLSRFLDFLSLVTWLAWDVSLCRLDTFA